MTQQTTPTLEWRTTSGGIEIAEYDNMAFIVLYDGVGVVYKNGKVHDACNKKTPEEAKEWFRLTHCKLPYIVETFSDGGEIYKSLNGERVAFIPRTITEASKTYYLQGDGNSLWCDYRQIAKNKAIAYVTFKDIS